MASNSDDFFGGFFDFDGDGKTDIAEQFVAYKFLEDIDKEDGNEEDGDNYVPDTTLSAPLRIARETNPPPNEKPIPERLALTEYKQWKRTLIGGCVFSMFFYVLLCVLPAFFVYAALSVLDTRESASVLVSTVVALGGLFLIACILTAAVKSVNDCGKRMRQAKGAYLKFLEEK